MKVKFDKYWGDIEKINFIIFFASSLDPTNKLDYLEYSLGQIYGDDGSILFFLIKSLMFELFEDYKALYCRGSFQSFITFAYDLNRYGHVYLMKHKSESFEMFKIFKNEVQNQLSKNIKALRSDRGGEYLSQEFINHLKDYRIIS